MGTTKARLDAQVQNACEYNDDVVPSEAAFETTPACAEEDFHNVISQLSNILDGQAGNWWDTLIVPSTLDTGTARGVNNLNTDLHALERKRFLEANKVLVDIPVGAADNFVILGAAALPGQTTLAVGAVSTLGTAAAAHTGAFGAHSLDEVTGANALGPCNLLTITDSVGDPILDSNGKVIHGLMQSESGVDASVSSATTPDRLQISFVVANAANDDLIAAAPADIQGKTIRYCYCEQKAFEDLSKGALANKSAAIDIGAGAVTVSRQAAYDNQGTTPVDLTTNATLDLEGPGVSWEIRDDAEAALISVIEGSAAGTSEFDISADVDLFDNNALVNDFENGATFDSGAAGTAINVGVTPNQIDAGGALTVASGGAGDLDLSAANALNMTDGYQAGSTWGTPMTLADSAAEWDELENCFPGEPSLASMLCTARNSSTSTKSCVDVTVSDSAGTNIAAASLSAAIHDMSGGDYAGDHDLYYNGMLLREGAGNDYVAGTSTAGGELILAFKTKVGDNICVISRA